MWNGEQTELNTALFQGAVGDLLDDVIERCAARRISPVSGFDILYCLLRMKTDSAEFLALSEEKRNEYANTALLLRNHLADGVTAEDCIEAIDAVLIPGREDVNPFLRECWLPALSDIVDGLEKEASIHELLHRMFTAEASVFGTEAELADSLFIPVGAPPVAAEIFLPDGALNEAAFSRRFLYLLGKGLEITSDSGQDAMTVLHVLYASVCLRESYTNTVLDKAGISHSESKCDTAFQAYLYRASARSAVAPMHKDGFSKKLVDVLARAMRTAVLIGRDQIGEREFLIGVLQSEDANTLNFLENMLGWPLHSLRETVQQTSEPELIVPVLPSSICTAEYLGGDMERQYVQREDVQELIIKNLLRRDFHNVILCGESGTGRTCIAYSLAQALQRNEYKSLRYMPVIYVDLTTLPDQKYMAGVEALLEFMDKHSHRIYVLDGFYRYFKENIHGCEQRLTHNQYKLLMILSPQDMIGLQNPKEPADLPIITKFLQENVNIVDIPEPSRDVTLKIIENELPLIESRFHITIRKDIGTAVYRMANDYLLAHRFPKKAIGLLTRTAANIAAEAELNNQSNPEMTKEDVAARLSDITELPVETILGMGTEKDYLSILSKSVKGQGVAVAKVADRLDLIQKGLVDKTKPAAIFLFAGLSGTGKTELAKQIAQVYSNSRKLITFAMADFPEAHSISGLLGSPAGYVGYEEGGKLIKDLNRDPYSVVLLDEVEKAHPKIWDPFLNLFDEGIITDRRGVTAYGNKSFFVLTSNIGQFEIAEMISRNAPMSVIEDTVKHELANARFNPSGGGGGEKCFRPEFLGRIMPRGGIVVFNALSREALAGIARNKVYEIARNYSNTHEGSKLAVDDAVIEMIANTAWERNEKAIRVRDAYVGGRGLGELLDEHVNKKISAEIRKIASAPLVRIVMDGGGTTLTPVYSEAEAGVYYADQRKALIAQVADGFSKISAVESNALDGMDEAHLIRMNTLLSEVCGTIKGEK